MFRSISSLLFAVFLLEIGSGLQGILIPIRGELAGFPTLLLGGLTAGIEATLAVFVLIRTYAEAPVPAPDRAAFAVQPPLSHGTQAVIELQAISNIEGDAPAGDGQVE